MKNRDHPATDPRQETPIALAAGVAPVVALPRQGLPKGLLIALAILSAVILFIILDARRLSLVDDPAIKPAQTATISPPPPLYIPLPTPSSPAVQSWPLITPATVPVPSRVRSAPYVPPMAMAPPIYSQQPAPYSSLPSSRSGQMSTEPAMVVDSTAASQEGNAVSAPAGGAQTTAPMVVQGTRSRAGVLANRSTTVPRGTLIPAVLETGFNSTWPGLARAIVSRDIRGFDGTRVLIPRGSRVVGEYSSDASPGQNRAMVNWTQLVRPDGAVINLSSPTADSIGRGGVAAKVNNHFFQRFASAMLQSAIYAGSTLAGGRSSSPVIVAAPGSAQTISSLVPPNQLTPTLTVRPGTSISVFVARDLDFTGVERLR